MSLERLVGQESTQVGVTVESDTEEVPGLALEPICGLPDTIGRRHARIYLVERDLDPETLVGFKAGQMINDLESLFAVGIVDPADVE